MRFLLACVTLVLAVQPWHSLAQSQDVVEAIPDEQALPVDADVIEMDTVVVSGVQPGPGLWKVRDGERTLYILGTVSPLPSGMEWHSEEVVGVLEQAGAILGSPGVAIGADVGVFRGLTLLPSAMKAINNPDGKTLEQVLPADVYARWSVLKARHLGRDRGVEKKRPLFAASELYQGAIKRAGLRGGVIDPVIKAALKRRKMKATSTVLDISIDDPKAAIADFRAESLRPEDIACFSRTMDIVERDLPGMVARANAWAIGDIEALQSMPLENQYRACLSAWSDSEFARKRGISDIDTRVRMRWMDVAVAALEKHETVFATMPIAELIRPGGYLELLAAKGYEVESP